MMTDVEPMKAIDGHAPYFIYHGDKPNWLIMLAVSRDSDAVERS